MKTSIAILLSLVLAGCLDTSHEVSGDVGVAVEYSETEIKMVNGIVYVRSAIAGVTQECLPIDSSTLYDAEWGLLSVQALNRTIAYTQEEIDNCI